MAGLENLFVTNPALPQVLTYKLPDDMGQWSEVLTTRLRELFPSVANMPITVSYQRKDPQSGTAIGALNIISEQTQKSVIVPFIAKQYELSPLDIWMEAESQAVHALSDDTFKSVFFAQSPAEGLDARPADSAGNYFNDQSLWNQNYPPLQGRYSYASAGYQFLDSIADTIRESDLEDFRNSLRAEPTLIMNFEKQGHKDLITKLAKMKGKAYGAAHRNVKPDSNDFAASAVKLIPAGAASLKKEGPDKYSFLQSADMMFDLMDSENIDGRECAKMMEKITGKPWDAMHDVDQSGERMLPPTSKPEKGVFLFDDYRDRPELATEFADYRVKTQDGVQIEGKVLPHVVSFDGKKMPYKLFISASHSCMQNNIAGVKETNGTPSKAAWLTKLEGRARVGQTGTFLFVDDGKAIATEPVTIKAVEVYGPITAIKLDGTKIKISRGYSMASQSLAAKVKSSTRHDIDKPKVLDVHAMIEQRPGEYVIPQGMVWIPMERFSDVVSTPDEWMDKEAQVRQASDPFTIRYTGIVFETEGHGETKLALDERRTKILLANKGCPLEKIGSFLKKAKLNGRIKVMGLRHLRKKADIIKQAEASYGNLERIVNSIKTDLMKVASEIDHSSTVDSLLALKFLNPENLSKFVSYRPIFEKIQDYLAELVLAVRLGMKDMPESAPVIAIQKLKDVIQGLKSIEGGLKVPASKNI